MQTSILLRTATVALALLIGVSARRPAAGDC